MSTRHRVHPTLRSSSTSRTRTGLAAVVPLLILLAPVLTSLSAPALAEPAPAVPSRYDTPDDIPGYGASDGTADAPAWSESAYTYFRVVEGSATLFPATFADEAAGAAPAEEPQEVVPNQPVLTGDRLRVDRGSRLELVLSDDDLLRVGEGSEVLFERISRSPDTDDRQTVLYLPTGEIQMVVFEASGSEPPVIDTPAGRILLKEPGSYRISAAADVYGTAGFTRVTVREGVAELVTDHGSVLVRAGDEARIESGDRPRVAFATAGGEDSLERWGRSLWQEATRADTGPVTGSLRYSATRLQGHGDWVRVDGRTAWRPRVASDWHPYRIGRWVYTPSGFLWVSHEPWGWVPYHYGTWTLDPGYGWVWYPGDVFAPAWVYWYWGPSHVAWVPIGYYSHHYAHHYAGGFGAHFGFRFGLYGFAGGPHRHFRHWVFCDLRHFHDRHLHHHAHPGFFDHRTRRDVVPRGVVTTDTRGFKRREVLDARRVATELPRRLGTRRGDELPDVTRFVAREPRLGPDLERRLVARRPEARLAGTPLAPGTRRPEASRPDRPTTSRAATPRRVTPRGGGPGAEPGSRGPESRTLSRSPGPRGATPRGDTALRSRSPRETPTRDTPRAVRPRTVEPRTSPRATSPRESSPRDTPRAVRPRTVEPRTSPRATTPRESSPRATSPRTISPRARPRTVEPRRAPPSARPDRPRAVTPRDDSPRATSPRASSPRATSPRSGTPRATTPRTIRPRTVTPRSTTPGTTPRSPGTRRPSGRSPSSIRGSAPTRRPTTRQPTTSRRPTPRRPSVQPQSSSGVRRAAPSRSGPTPRSGVSSRRSSGSRSPGVRSGSNRSGSSRAGASRGRSGSSRGNARSSRGSRRGTARRGGGG